MNIDIKSLSENVEAQLRIVILDKTLLESCEDKTLLEKSGFKAEQDEVLVLHEKAIIYGGVEKEDVDSLRSLLAQVVRVSQKFQYTSATLTCNNTKLLQAIVEGTLLGNYKFDMYKSKKNAFSLESLIISVEDESVEEARLIAQKAIIISNSTNFTRNLVNTTPEDMNPIDLADVARELSNDNNLTCNILNEAGLEKENMNAMLAVGRASRHQSQLIHLSYTPTNPKKIISLVGKGLTYDSGGLSLKPASSMVTMKMDKAGGCAVLGMIKAISELKLDVEVHAFVGAVENMVDGSAYKPDDVLTSKKGDTIEVRNTDAEGRLVLADVLTYAQENVKADYIFDYATLTGACMVALGQYTVGVMGHSHGLKHKLGPAVKNSGELTGSLPFNRHLKKLLKSEIADICNISSKPYGGAITAGLFLDNFIDEDMKDKWMHFDIAGAAYTESAWDVNGYGATGAGVRLTVALIDELINKKPRKHA